jgi:hypothetical protein
VFLINTLKGDFYKTREIKKGKYLLVRRERGPTKQAFERKVNSQESGSDHPSLQLTPSERLLI